MENWTITEIENITEDRVKEMAVDTMKIKEHNIFCGV